MSDSQDTTKGIGRVTLPDGTGYGFIGEIFEKLQADPSTHRIQGGLLIEDPVSGNPVAALTSVNGHATFILANADGRVVAYLGSLPDTGQGFISLLNEHGRLAVELCAQGDLTIYDPSSPDLPIVACLNRDERGGTLHLYNGSSSARLAA